MRSAMIHFGVLVLPNVNCTKPFGMTQVEAMLAGTPVVTTDIPAVRIAVRVTQKGELVTPRDEKALAVSISNLLRNPPRFVGPDHEVPERSDPEWTAGRYDDLFKSLLTERNDPARTD